MTTSIRTIEFQVTPAGITPSAPQSAGVQGEHNATRVVFRLDKALIQEGYAYRVEFTDSTGAFDTTGTLLPEGDIVYCLLPCGWTRHGGIAEVRLCIALPDEQGQPQQVVYSFAGRLRFAPRAEGTPMSAVDAGGLSGMVAQAEQAIEQAEQATEAAVAVAKAVQDKLNSGAFVGEKGEKGDKGDKGDTGPGLRLLGSYADEQALIAAHPTAAVGDAYVVGDDLYVWNAAGWEDLGPLMELSELTLRDENGVVKGTLDAAEDEHAVVLETSRPQAAGDAAVKLTAKSHNPNMDVDASVALLATQNGTAKFYMDATDNAGLGVTTQLGDSTHRWYYVYTHSIESAPKYNLDRDGSLYLNANTSSGNGSSSIVRAEVVLRASAYSPTSQYGLTPSRSTSTVTLGFDTSLSAWSLYPAGTIGAYLGSSSYKWNAVYATEGTVQTSDRASKDDIRYLVDESAPMVLSLTDEDTGTTPASVTVGDVMDFVRSLAPVTFCYKNGAENASEDTARPESIQLGLIADEIEAHPLFRYIGVKSEYEEVVKPEELDEDGNVVAEAVTETRTGFGLQAIPLATVALTACKRLAGELDSVNARLAAMELRLEEIMSKEEA